MRSPNEIGLSEGIAEERKNLLQKIKEENETAPSKEVLKLYGKALIDLAESKSKVTRKRARTLAADR